MNKTADFKMSNLLISLTMLTIVIAVLGSFVAFTNLEYQGTNLTSEQQDVLDGYSELNTVLDRTEDVKNNSNLKSGQDNDDQLGVFFSQGYNNIRLLGESVESVENVGEHAANSSIFLGSEGEGRGVLNTIKTGLIGIIFILIFIGLLIAIAVKWPV